MRSIEVSDLPPKYQQQVLAQMAAAHIRKANAAEPARQKYGNQKVDRGALHFDSKKEARRFDELQVMLQAGEIRDLRLQVDFTLQEAYTTPAGERIRAIRYKADFTYYRRGGEYVVEDVKSAATKTAKYAMKKKMMADRFGLTITEI